MFKQNAYTDRELWWHKFMGFVCMVTMYILIGFKFGALPWLIVNLPFPMALGHGFKCISICFWFIIPSFIFGCIFKLWVYWAIAFLLGMEPLHLMDSFWIYDTPANPINVPEVLVFKKPSSDLKLGPQ